MKISVNDLMDAGWKLHSSCNNSYHFHLKDKQQIALTYNNVTGRAVISIHNIVIFDDVMESIDQLKVILTRNLEQERSDYEHIQDI